ncbi:hypothetical protein OPV22_019321 [Ensete ventricosum]|uniref:Uncharacterized protein n=1 Tax=Ensete ventricosum TaxID=4639 RepID=A0AAV8Q7B7_ENSVE|nr:hypothetical protein OPV22_019321 [Ensete ventricosum]
MSLSKSEDWVTSAPAMAGIQLAFVNRRPSSSSSSSSSPDGTPRAGEVTDGLPVQEVMDAWETGSAKARETHSDDGMVKGLVQRDISPFLVLCSSAASTAVALAASKRGEEEEGGWGELGVIRSPLLLLYENASV